MISSSAAPIVVAVTERWSDFPNAPRPGTEVCAVNDVPDGGARNVPFGRNPSFELLVTRNGANLRAYVNRCAHMRIALNLLDNVQVENARLVCDNHGAQFRFSDGYCEIGPCEGDSLVAVPLELRDGRVRIAS
jgi:nitrite reductase/ring-hydroxylating ferredoxin subunit